MTFRGLLMWVHLVLGLTGAIVVAVLSATGAYITFQGPLQRWLNPVPAIAPFTGSTDFPAIVQAVEQQFTPQRVASIDVRREQATIVRLGNRTTVFVDPHTGTIISARAARFASLENLTTLMRRLHTELLMGRKGRLLATLATAEALLLALTGLWLWWRKKHWQFRAWRGSAFRVSWDLHNASGIWFVLPVVSMVVTGLLLAVPAPVYKVAGARPAPWRGVPGSNAAGREANTLPLTRALSVGDSAVPGEPVVRVVIPLGPRGAYTVTKSGKTVFIDQFNASVIDVRGDRELTAGDHALETVERLHTGALWGVPGQAIMTLGCVMLVVMTVTGVVLGWKRLLILFRIRAEADGAS